MTAKGFGKDRPIADNKTADSRLQNRRVTLRIVGLQ
jgi:outer membrane protein OmpA-like peptidoglycan-associated protein